MSASSPTLPAIFVGHGNPMNALQDNAFTRAWAALGGSVPRPRAVLAVSAHWTLPRVAVTAMPAPRTIHDFGGFPRELFQVEYPAPGEPALARRVRELLAPIPVEADDAWGLDHGTWSVLRHVFPQADVPVVQLSLDETREPEAHYEIGKRLGPLRDEGILVLGLGNLVHNLRLYDWNRGSGELLDQAAGFERKVKELIQAGDHDALIHYESLGRGAELSVPTPEHFLPLLYVLALRREGEAVSFPVEGADGGSISMLSIRIG
jgi:4,5-DOPA dioxygenase extradiol